MTLFFEWCDPRLQWRQETDIGDWMFFPAVHYPAGEVWVPNFRLANCQDDRERCAVRSQDPKRPLRLLLNGYVHYTSEMKLRSTCTLNLLCMYTY